jgi:short-chain Z-isoprenyl diphosphate synthase
MSRVGAGMAQISLSDLRRDRRQVFAPTVVWTPVEIIPPRLKEPLYRIYELRLRQGLAASKSALPRHIAVLCDGNRRWARDAGYDDVSYGYRMGAAKIAEMLRWCAEAGIEMATVYLLSTENLRRDPDELAALIEIITDVVEEICAPANRWSVRTVGDLELIGEEPARRLREAVESTPSNAGFHVNVAVAYGGRQEIVGAVRALLSKELANGATAEELVDAVTVDAISENLYTSGQPDPDLVIRTSGEQRLSGFLLWQSAYSEMWFTEAHWPAFRRVDFLRALRDYSLRHRRYGI